MLKRFQSAGAVLTLIVAAGLPMHGLEAAVAQSKATEAQPKQPETQAKSEQPQPTTGEAAPEVGETVSEGEETAPSTGMKTFDALAVRPVTFISSVFSAGAFVLALPFAALDPAMNVEQTRKNLVEEPFQDTFQRPLGDFNGSAW